MKAKAYTTRWQFAILGSLCCCLSVGCNMLSPEPETRNPYKRKIVPMREKNDDPNRPETVNDFLKLPRVGVND
jgi:hypothetical protein